jgi:hypothetical protein
MHSAYSLRTERSNQLVRRMKLAMPQLWRGHRLENSNSLDDIHTQESSVVCVLSWPSHRATLRKSAVAWSMFSAQVRRRPWGDTDLPRSDGQTTQALPACLGRRYSKPSRVIRFPRALRKSSEACTEPRTAIQVRSESSGLEPVGKRVHVVANCTLPQLA